MLGKPTAPVTLVEYADLQCPYCARVAVGDFPAIVRDYVRTGNVRVIFQGLSFVGPDSDTALQTALSAGDQHRLWNVVQLLYANQGAENSGWVDGRPAARCRQGGAAARRRVDADRTLGRRVSRIRTRRGRSASAATAGVTGTPSFAVGGRTAC